MKARSAVGTKERIRRLVLPIKCFPSSTARALAAYDILRHIHARLATREALEFIELELSADNSEAQALGWPTASAHAAVVRRIIESLHPGNRHLIRIVPHRSTLASAGTSAKAH